MKVGQATTWLAVGVLLLGCESDNEGRTAPTADAGAGEGEGEGEGSAEGEGEGEGEGGAEGEGEGEDAALPDPRDAEVAGDAGPDAGPDVAADVPEAVNLPPEARCGADRRVEAGTLVRLNGAGSSDADGAPLTFAWRLVESPEGFDGGLDDPATVRPRLLADRPGTWLVELIVHDGETASPPDTLSVVAVEPGGVAPDAPASIGIGDEVVARDVEPLGANLTRIAGGTNLAVNNHVNGSGFEPMVLRRLVRVERAGRDEQTSWLEWDTFGGVHFHDTNATGFGNGARVRFYRIVDAAGAPLAWADGLHDTAGADRVVFLGEARVPLPGGALPEGGWVAEGSEGANRVHVDDPALDLAFGDYAFLTIEKTRFPAEEAHPRLHGWWSQDQPYLFLWGDDVAGRLVPHPQPLPAAFDEPGQTCLRITSGSAERHSAGQWVYHPYDDGEGQWYTQLTPGATYRVEAWLRQEGLGDGGRVRFAFVGNRAYEAANQAEPWAVTGQWQRYTYDFVAPEWPAPDSGMHIGHALQFTGPGTLWVDNLLLYRFDEAHGLRPFGPHETSLRELLASVPERGPKPAVRFYPLQYGNSHMEAMLGNYGNASLDVNSGRFGPFGGATVAQSLAWAHATGDSPEERVVPHLTLSEELTEPDWAALLEYLGVPYDPARDTPESLPHAYVRYRQRGEVSTPWTAEFREILLEYGNETWHSGAGGYGWHGFGRPGWVHRGGLEYGLFARFLFEEQLPALPLWEEHGLADRIRFVLGGNYQWEGETGYGELAVRQTSAVSYLGHANYVGPKWETNDEGSSRFDDHGVQETLLGLPTGMAAMIEGAAAARDLIEAETGTAYRLIAYEGGPSGYWTNRDTPEVDELYGKSLAMGVAALDTWLYSSLHGFGHQCFLGFSSGVWWSSHTLPEAGGFRAHPGWLALRLRNRHAPGDAMLSVTVEHGPRLLRGEQALPLVSAYALSDAGTGALSVFVLSRKLDGDHDGVDFGDGHTPVTLHLPLLEPPESITLHRLAHPDGSPADPRENNRERLNVDIVSEPIDPAHYAPDFVIDERTGGEPGGMPPGTVYLYVFAP